MEIMLRYGRRGLNVSLPDANVQHVLRFCPLPAVTQPQRALRDALDAPDGCAPAADLAAGRRDACIVTADITRPVPNALIIPALLEKLAEGGLPAERVTVLIGTGLHRGNTEDELREMLGEDVLASGARIVNHDARDEAGQVRLGTTVRGTPVFVDRAYAEADLKISVSLVEPHLMAGFSGGRKAICPGICGAETIRHFHGPRLLAHDESRAGVIGGNPVHEESLEAAQIAGAPDLTVNVTLDEQRRVTGISVGELEAAHASAVRQSVSQSKTAIPEPVDIVVTTNAGHPLDLTFYQGVKGMIAATPILKPGGTIIIAHECAEGIGGPEFTELILSTGEIGEFVERLADPEFFCIDQWQLQEHAKVLATAGEVMSLSEGVSADQLGRCFVTPIDSVEAAVGQALAKHGADATIAVIPEGPYVLACVEGDTVDRQTR